MTRSATGPAPGVPLPSPVERRRLREARALSEEQVATAVGVTPATVRAWETGRASPRGRRRTAYARLIGCAEGRPAPHLSVEATGSSTMSPTEPGTIPALAVTTTTGRTASAGDAPAREGFTAEKAFDALYDHAAPGLTRQMYLLTGRRRLAREAVEHAFRIAWQRWPEVARDRDPAGWARAAAYEYAMSPWHRLRRAHRRADAPPEDPERHTLLDALLGLPPSYRRTLLLHDGVGLGLPETAAETEASTLAAANRLVHARAAVVEQLAGPSELSEAGHGTLGLHGRLSALALAEEVPAPPPAPVVRAGSERIAELWTRAALCFGVLLVSATAFTLHTAPTQYEQPLSPAERVGGVPPRGGPEHLTPQDLKLQKALRGELTHGPERLVPRIP